MIERACDSVGIDLGTTYSAMAYMDRNLTPRMVINSQGQSIVPSVIYFDEDEEIVVGETALEESQLHPGRIAQFVKVHMGEDWRQEFAGHVHSPESLSAIILGHLAAGARPQLGEISSAVVTVPAYFTEKRRRATQQAGEIAGLNVVGTLNEPMAAMLAHGLHREDREQFVAVYDLGGGTFDVTIVRIAPGEIEELATDGNRELGGKDWDDRLIEYWAEDFRKAHSVDPRSDPQGAQELRLACERAKRKLSDKRKATVRVHACGTTHTLEITRELFERLTSSLLQSTRLTMEMALSQAQLDWNRLSRVVLVGGSTHMPAVHDMIEQAFGRPPEFSVNPVMAVALGAAVYAHMLDTGQAPTTLKLSDRQEAERSAVSGQHSAAGGPERGGGDGPVRGDAGTAAPPAVEESNGEAAGQAPKVTFVTAHGVGVRIRRRDGQGWKNSVLIPRNTRLPAMARERFVAVDEINTDSFISIHITQGDHEEIELVEILGEGRIEGFSQKEPPGQPVEVTMEFDARGRLHIKAVYVNTGKTMHMTLEVAGGLRPEEVQEHNEHLRNIGFLKPNESPSDAQPL